VGAPRGANPNSVFAGTATLRSTLASRKEEKERLRQERLASQQAELERTRRRTRLYGLGAAGVLIIGVTVAIVVVVAALGGDDGSGGSASGAGSLSSANTDGLAERRKAAGVPTMGEAEAVGASHFHPQLRINVNGKQIKLPANIGIDPGDHMDMAGLHTHDSSGTIHNEAGTSARLGQFFAVWGVPLSAGVLGPHRATKTKKIKMWVDDKPSREFRSLKLEDGQQIVIAYGTKAQEPIK
jgi:hypothetical protein